MSKHNSHRFHLPVKSGPRFRFQLPEDLREVELTAFAQGMINATEHKKQGLQLTPEAIEAGAIEAALRVEQEKRGGKQGCNDPILFRQTFSAMCAHIWRATYEYWEAEPEIYAGFLRQFPPQRAANARIMAEKFLDPVKQMIADGKKIIFEW